MLTEINVVLYQFLALCNTGNNTVIPSSIYKQYLGPET